MEQDGSPKTTWGLEFNSFNSQSLPFLSTLLGKPSTNYYMGKKVNTLQLNLLFYTVMYFSPI